MPQSMFGGSQPKSFPLVEVDEKKDGFLYTSTMRQNNKIT